MLSDLTGRVLLRRRAVGGLLGGMWAFPEQEVDRERPGDDALDREAERAASSLCSELGVLSCGRPERRPAHRHRFTHIDATYVPYRIGVTGRPASPPDAAWVVPGEPTDLALPAAQRRVLDALAGGRSPDDGS